MTPEERARGALRARPVWETGVSIEARIAAAIREAVLEERERVEAGLAALDPLDWMNRASTWEDPPPSDVRWELAVARAATYGKEAALSVVRGRPQP